MTLRELKDFLKELVSNCKGDIEKLKERITIIEKAAAGEIPFANALDDPKFVELVNKMKEVKVDAGLESAAGNTVMNKLKKGKEKK